MQMAEDPAGTQPYWGAGPAMLAVMARSMPSAAESCNRPGNFPANPASAASESVLS